MPTGRASSHPHWTRENATSKRHRIGDCYTLCVHPLEPVELYLKGSHAAMKYMLLPSNRTLKAHLILHRHPCGCMCDLELCNRRLIRIDRIRVVTIMIQLSLSQFDSFVVYCLYSGDRFCARSLPFPCVAIQTGLAKPHHLAVTAGRVAYASFLLL